MAGQTDASTPEMRAAQDKINKAEQSLKTALTQIAMASVDWHSNAGDDAQDGNLPSQSLKVREAKSKHGADTAKAAADTADTAGESANIYDGTEDDNKAQVQRVQQTVEKIMGGMTGLFT